MRKDLGPSKGRVVKPPRIPRTCLCEKTVVHKHQNNGYWDHWCNLCGGYLGTAGLAGPAIEHENCDCSQVCNLKDHGGFGPWPY